MRRLVPLLLVLTGVQIAPALGARWIVRPDESTISVEFKYLGSPVLAEFRRFSATIDFDPVDLEHSAADVRIDTASFDSQNQDRDELAKEEDWFAVARYPEARFLTRSIRQISPGRYEAGADLTIRGLTKRVTLPFVVTITGNVARMEGAVSLVRADFGVGPSTKEVGGAVRVLVKATADQAP